ncbi:MAG: hypothetical protein GX806_06215 [Lentisphaerae bacterium]|nr:hypothetical protein [Lentisphaerota bacterium]
MQLTNQGFDVAGHTISRTWRLAPVYALIPLGRRGRGGGPGWWLCAWLWLWHRWGGQLWRCAMRFETQALWIYARLARWRRRAN